MKIVQVLLELLENIDFEDEMKVKVKELIDSAVPGMTSNPRDGTDGNREFLRAMLVVVLGEVEGLYGHSNAIKVHPYPFFQDQPRSQVGPLKGDSGAVGVALGNFVRGWEGVFYDVCHESLHLLDPVLNVQGAELSVSALEEGCAVKFAEQMLEKHIKPYCDDVPCTSPVAAANSPYFSAYSAAKKIPDGVLKEVRKVFGRFSKIDDAEKFKKLVGKHVNDEEAGILVRPFAYH